MFENNSLREKIDNFILYNKIVLYSIFWYFTYASFLRVDSIDRLGNIIKFLYLIDRVQSFTIRQKTLEDLRVVLKTFFFLSENNVFRFSTSNKILITV